MAESESARFDEVLESGEHASATPTLPKLLASPPTGS
jgi:hypothetical protein